MTNPPAFLRILVTYAVCIPAAIFVGYLLTNPLDYGTIGFLGLVLVFLLSPLFIKWHYPIMVFGLGFPMTCFFLLGSPPLSQVVVLLSLGIAIIERTLNREKRFIRVPAMTWPLMFIAVMVLMTAKLTGGIGLHALGGGGGGGGKKYIAVLLGVGVYFALTSRVIPPEKRKLYLMLYMLPALAGMISDLLPILPGPLAIINLLFPSYLSSQEDVEVGTTRLTALSFAMIAVPYFLVARYGLRGVFLERQWWRPILLLVCFALSLLGGFRNIFGGFILFCILMFFLEGLHRTRLVPVLLLAGILGSTVLAVFSEKLPYTLQRSMSFLPLKWDTAVLLDAESSTEWRFQIWRATWPKVPEYLMLGKGYSLSREDFEMIGQGTFARLQSSHINASEESLAISNDFHSGPLSTLICFGVWGAIGILWLMGASVFVAYRNYRFGTLELKTFNAFTLASTLSHIIFFFFIFGGFNEDVGAFAMLAGFNIAMNGGMAARPPRPVSNFHMKPAKSRPISLTQPV